MTAVEHDPVTLLDQRETPCLARLTRERTWQPTLALAVGGRVIGIRANCAEGSQAVEHHFGAVRAPGNDPVARPNFSLELGAATAPGRRALNLVYRDHVVVARRREPEAVVADLVELVMATALDQDTGHVALRASAVLGEGGVTLVPPEWHAQLLRGQSRLAADGLELLPPTVHVVDENSLELVRKPWEPSDPSSRFNIGSWTVSAQADQPLSGAGAVHATFYSVANRTVRGAAATLRSLVGVCAGVPVAALVPPPKAMQLATARELALTDRRGSGGRAF